MMKVAVGTKNKAKVQAVKAVVTQFYGASIEALAVASDVSEQPMTNEETRQGAINRARHARSEGNAELGFGLEGGVTLIDGQLYICNWVALATPQRIYTAAGAQLPLPPIVADAVLAGEELGPVMERYAQQKDVRQHQGAIGIFTDGLVTRQQMFEHILLLVIGQYRYQ